MEHVHISDVLAYKTCRRAWDFSSPLRQNQEPAQLYAPFFVGTAFHEAMEHLYKHQIPVMVTAADIIRRQALLVQQAGLVQSFEEDALEDQAELVMGMLEHYELWRQKDRSEWADRNWTFMPEYAEYTFTAPLYNPQGKRSNKVALKGRIDNIARHKVTGRLWIWEFKTCRSLIERVSLLPYDEQASAYISAASHFLGEPVAGIMYTLARKKAPTRPRVLQNGRLSDAKNIDTSLEMFIKHAQEQYATQLVGLEPAQQVQRIQQWHPAVISELASKPQRFFWRVPLRRTAPELQQASAHLWQVALEMVNPKTPAWPHGGFHCQFCRFRQPCQEMNQGASVQEALAACGHEYQPRTQYYGTLLPNSSDDN